MWPFRRKPDVPAEPTPCQHKWKDFPWFIQRTSELDKYGDFVYKIHVWQPYVCVKCKERRDERLETLSVSTTKDREREYTRMMTEYADRVLPIAVVEDMVKDEQLVDREYLRLMDEFQNPSSPFDNLDLLRVELEKVKSSMAQEEDGLYASKR